MNQATFDYVPEKSEEIETAATPHPEPMRDPANSEPPPPSDTGTELVVIDPKSQELVKMFSDDKGLDPIIEKIRQRVNSEVLDVSTAKGRERIGSIARQIGSAKMNLKRMGQDLTEDWRIKTKAVTSETSRMEKELDAMRDEVLAPRVEFENREKARTDAHESRLAQLQNIVIVGDQKTAAEIQADLDTAAALYKHDWEEFKDRADQVWQDVEPRLKKRLEERQQYEKDQAELAERRRIQAEEEAWDAMWKEAHDENDRLTKAAEKARKDAEEKAEKERIEAEEKAAAEKKALEDKAEEERLAKEKAEEDRKAGLRQTIFKMAELAKTPEPSALPLSTVLQSRLDAIASLYDRDWQEFKEQADEVFTVTTKNLGMLRDQSLADEAEEKRKADQKIKDDAAQAEKDRIAAEQKEKDDAAAKREQDKTHKAKVNNAAAAAILIALQSVDDMEDAAKAVVEAIALGKVPKVKIEY